VGDPLYGKRFGRLKGMSDEQAQAVGRFPRQALHASALALLHPETGEQMIWRVDLPEDLQELIEVLRDVRAPA
jgi:23S rRNA pseudouridine1911/1915/1917 synthase